MSNPPKTREEMRRLQQEAAAKRARITRMVGAWLQFSHSP